MLVVTVTAARAASGAPPSPPLRASRCRSYATSPCPPPPPPVCQVAFRDTVRYKLDKQLFVAAEGLYSGQYIYCGKKAT